MIMLILLMILLNATLFMFMSHPLSFGFLLLIQTINISLMTGLMSLNYWFSYILFLIMIGGMLILFIYMTSIASNEKFKFSYKLTQLIISMLLILSFLLFLDYYFIHLNMSIIDLSQNPNNFNFIDSLKKFLNWPFNTIFYMIIIYLLLTLIMVVKITNIQYGPLRQKL